MTGYAQTNIQLYKQLRELGYRAADLERIHQAHALAMRLFTGAFRGSGRQFLAHLVGTASVLAWLRAPIAVVAAGLLHSAYSHGEFGNFWRGMAGDKRRRVRDAVGSEVEQLVAEYTRLPWRAKTIAALADDVDSLTEEQRSVLLIRLANEVDDHQDQGLLYVREVAHRQEFIRTALRPCVGIAERLGYPALAAELARVFEETMTGEIPATLQGPGDESFLLAPSSHTWRPAVVARWVLARAYGTLRLTRSRPRP
ncbi:MAG TPA: HD domain-containing protein [Methylomirabilota bacterium]